MDKLTTPAGKRIFGADHGPGIKRSKNAPLPRGIPDEQAIPRKPTAAKRAAAAAARRQEDAALEKLAVVSRIGASLIAGYASPEGDGLGFEKRKQILRNPKEANAIAQQSRNDRKQNPHLEIAYAGFMDDRAVHEERLASLDLSTFLGRSVLSTEMAKLPTPLRDREMAVFVAGKLNSLDNVPLVGRAPEVCAAGLKAFLASPEADRLYPGPDGFSSALFPRNFRENADFMRGFIVDAPSNLVLLWPGYEEWAATTYEKHLVAAAEGHSRLADFPPALRTDGVWKALIAKGLAKAELIEQLETIPLYSLVQFPELTEGIALVDFPIESLHAGLCARLLTALAAHKGFAAERVAARDVPAHLREEAFAELLRIGCDLATEGWLRHLLSEFRGDENERHLKSRPALLLVGKHKPGELLSSAEEIGEERMKLVVGDLVRDDPGFIASNPGFLEWAADREKTLHVCTVAVDDDSLALQHVPYPLKLTRGDDDLCELAFAEADDDEDIAVIEFMPPERRDEFYERLEKIRSDWFTTLDDSEKTESVCAQAISRQMSWVHALPKDWTPQRRSEFLEGLPGPLAEAAKALLQDRPVPDPS